MRIYQTTLINLPKNLGFKIIIYFVEIRKKKNVNQTKLNRINLLQFGSGWDLFGLVWFITC